MEINPLNSKIIDIIALDIGLVGYSIELNDCTESCSKVNKSQIRNHGGTVIEGLKVSNNGKLDLLNI